MSSFDQSMLGTILVMFGLAASLLTFVLLRTVQQTQPKTMVAEPVSTPTDDHEQPEEGILIVQAGGRVSYINKRAREYFDAWEGIPCLLYTSPSPRDRQKSRMPSSA
jgi:sensor histidine kinase regulating citrate/malate metabolism